MILQEYSEYLNGELIYSVSDTGNKEEEDYGKNSDRHGRKSK